MNPDPISILLHKDKAWYSNTKDFFEKGIKITLNNELQKEMKAFNIQLSNKILKYKEIKKIVHHYFNLKNENPEKALKFQILCLKLFGVFMWAYITSIYYGFWNEKFDLNDQYLDPDSFYSMLYRKIFNEIKEDCKEQIISIFAKILQQEEKN